MDNPNNVPAVDGNEAANTTEAVNEVVNAPVTPQPNEGENQNETSNTPNVDNVTPQPDNGENQNETGNTSNVVNVTPQPTSDKPKKKTGLIVGIIIGVVVLIAAILFAVYSLVLNNPTTIVKNAINDFYEKTSSKLKEYEKNEMKFNIAQDTMKVNGDIKLGGTLFKGAENSKISFATTLDYKNKLAEINLGLNEENKDIADVSLYLKNNHNYMKSNTLFDNVYDSGEQDFNEMFNFEDLISAQNSEINLENVDIILKESKDALIKSIDKKYMTKGNANINIGDKEVKVKTIVYSIEKDSVKSLFTGISKELLASSKFIDTISKMTGQEKSAIEEVLNSLGKEENYDDISSKGQFVIYTTGLNNKVVGVEFGDEETTIRYYSNEDDGYFAVIENKETLFDVVAKKQDVRINYYEEGKKTEIAKLTIKKNDAENIDVDYEISYSGMSVSGNLKLTAKKENDKKVSGNLGLTIEVAATGSEKMSLGLDMNYALEIGAPITDIDVSKALPVEQMTASDQQKMLTTMEALESSKLFTTISTLTGDTNSLM